MLIDDECSRPDCPVRGLDAAERERIAALPPVVREAITISWCRNPKIVDGSLCAAAVSWYLANHAARGRRDSSQDERTRAPRGVPRTTRGSNKRSITKPGDTISGVVQDETRRLP